LAQHLLVHGAEDQAEEEHGRCAGEQAMAPSSKQGEAKHQATRIKLSGAAAPFLSSPDFWRKKHKMTSFPQ